MAKKLIIAGPDIVENWGLDYYTGNALDAIWKAAFAGDVGMETKYLKEAVEALTRKIELSKLAKLRGAWKKAKKKQRTRKEKGADKGAGSTTPA